MRLPRFNLTDLLLIFAVVAWGANFSVVKESISGMNATFTSFAFNAIRFSIAAIFLWTLVRATHAEVPTSRRELLPILALGLVGNTLYQVFFITGIRYTTPANASLVLALVPVMVALIGAIMRIETLNRLAWIGVGMSFTGVAVVVLGNEPVASQSDIATQQVSALVGDLLTLMAAFVWALYTVFSAPLVKRHSPNVVSALSLSAGMIPLILIALPDLLHMDWSAIPFTGWSAVIYSGALGLGFSYAAWNRGVKHIGSARTAVYTNLVPIIAVTVAWVTRGDVLTVYHLLGAALVLSGITLTRRGRKPPAVASQTDGATVSSPSAAGR